MHGFDDTYSGEDVKRSPYQREQDPEITENIIKIKTILTEEEIDLYSSEKKLPSIREGTIFINGKAVEVIEELYRIDPTGKVVPNSDVAGYSWLYEYPIPGYLVGTCKDYFGVHDFGEGSRTFCNTKDGRIFEIETEIDGVKTTQTVAMCETCLRIYEYEISQRRIPFITKPLKL